MSPLPQALSASRVRAWAVWVVPVVALALLIGWETDWGRQIVRVPPTPVPAEPKPVTAVVLPEYEIEGGLPAHAETVQRTLFNATRRPAPVLAVDNGPRQIVRGKFLLMGTTVTGDRNIAFLKEVGGGGRTRVVRQGDELDGMKVALVTADRVQFIAGDDSEELVLKVAPGPKTTIAAAPPAPGAPVAATGAAAAVPAASRAAIAQAARAANAAQPDKAANDRASRRASRAGAAAGQDPSAGQGGQGGQGTGDSASQGGQRQRRNR